MNRNGNLQGVYRSIYKVLTFPLQAGPVRPIGKRARLAFILHFIAI